jgi:hypothetical protein
MNGEQLHAFQERFRESLDRWLFAITAELHGDHDEATLANAFHSLAGIGGTYGLPRVTDISRECEALCRHRLSSEEIADIESALGALRAAVA